MRLKSIAIFLIAFYLLEFPKMSAATPLRETCDLPHNLQGKIATEYPGARLLTLSDLDERDKKLFESDHADSCPGLVYVDFYGDGKPTLALVLISKLEAKEKALLVVAREVGGNWSVALLDTVDESEPVVWVQDAGEYRDVYGKKKIRATRPVIVFCGYDSWAVLYAWTGKVVAKIWLAD